MSTPILRGVVHGNTVVLHVEGNALPEGTEVEVTPVLEPRLGSSEAPRRGDPEALFAALDEVPPISDDDAKLILRIIEEEFRQIDDDAWKD